MLDDIRKYYDLIKETELRPLYEDDFQFEIIKNRQELENHIYDLDDDEKIRIRNAVENYLRDSESIVFYTSESAGEVYSSIEDFLVYLLNEILYQKLLANSERKRLSNYFMELEISIKKMLILIWTK
ncbi:hypothetical protein [uncultured Brachyspira sp.]|uniref:hypothetical protein n=1 Tax=uncultured Brachyspira sp. TaxID=221953 RepID=UPI00262F1337|nr:hypothetical protein [uncultured Brachyspira sp.]